MVVSMNFIALDVCDDLTIRHMIMNDKIVH